MAQRLANLFNDGHPEERVERDYTLFLTRLAMAGRYARIVEACRQIRRYAAGRPANFLLHIEIDAHDAQQQFAEAWRVLRRWEKVICGASLDLDSHVWTKQEWFVLNYFYAPLAFLTGRLGHSCHFAETALTLADRRPGWSYDLFWHIYKSEPATRRAAVTLSHIYAALGKDLCFWELWDEFVEDIHPRLLRKASLRRQDLRAEPARLEALYRAIVTERDKRLTSGTSSGLSDLTQPPATVRREQAARRKAILRVAESPQIVNTMKSIEALFPELNDLPTPPTMREILDARS